MRKFKALMVLAVVLFIISLAQLASLAQVNVIRADVNIVPDALLLKESGNGNWITVLLRIPDHSVNDIDVPSITLNVEGEYVSLSRYEASGNTLMVKFDRATVVSFLLAMTGHMSPHEMRLVTLEVTGNLKNGDSFEGTDTVRVFSTSSSF